MPVRLDFLEQLTQPLVGQQPTRRVPYWPAVQQCRQAQYLALTVGSLLEELRVHEAVLRALAPARPAPAPCRASRVSRGVCSRVSAGNAWIHRSSVCHLALLISTLASAKDQSHGFVPVLARDAQVHGRLDVTRFFEHLSRLREQASGLGRGHRFGRTSLQEIAEQRVKLIDRLDAGTAVGEQMATIEVVEQPARVAAPAEALCHRRGHVRQEGNGKQRPPSLFGSLIEQQAGEVVEHRLARVGWQRSRICVGVLAGARASA